MKIIFEGDLTAPSGYSRASRSHIDALLDAGVEVCGINKRKDKTVSLGTRWDGILNKIMTADRRGATIKIHHETPEYYDIDPNMKNVALVAWETDKIPSTDLQGQEKFNWVKQFNKMDQVWVPCSHNKKVFQDCGVIKPIYVVPHPMKIEDYPTTPLRPLYEFPDEKLTLLSVFQWQPRKDPLSLVMGAYESSVDLRLIIKTYGNTVDEGQADIVRRIREVKNSYHRPTPNQIYPCFDTIPDPEMPRLYRSAHAYITTSRGEGFCLPAVEAMAMGLPVIAPFGTAFQDFLTFGTGYPLSWVSEPVWGMAHIKWYSPEQRWMKVAHQDLLNTLKDVERDHKNGRLVEKGQAARKFVEENFESKKIGAFMRSLLEQL